MKTWKSCYEECATSAAPHCDKFLLSLTEKIEASIEKASKQETRLISNLKVAVSFCNTILTLIKFSGKTRFVELMVAKCGVNEVTCLDAFSHVKPVLLKISKSMPDLKTLTDSDLKSLAVKYVVTVLSYVKLFPAHSEDFSYIIKTFGPLLPKDVEEVSRISFHVFRWKDRYYFMELFRSLRSSLIKVTKTVIHPVNCQMVLLT